MVTVPRFAELSAKNLYASALANPSMRKHLPEPSEGSSLDPDDNSFIGVSREYLYNIINTCDENFFKKNIPEAYRKRREAEMEKRQQKLEIT